MSPRTIVYDRPHKFRVQVIVTVVGPDAPWGSVVQLLLKALKGKRLPGGYRIVDIEEDALDEMEGE